MFSRMRSKGSRFTLGVCGVEGVFARRCVYVRNCSQAFATVRNRSQPFATVRGRACEGRMAIPMVSSAKGVLLPSPCLWGKLPNFSFSKVSTQVVMSYCVASVALVDILTCLQRGVVLWFCVAGAILLRPFQKMGCTFRGRRSALETYIVILRGRRSASDVSRCVFLANTTARAASGGDNVQNPWQARHVVTCDDTSHFTLYTLHSTIYTLHFTPHSTLYTPHSTLYTLLSTLYTLHSTLYTLHSTLYTLHSALYALHSTLHTLHFALHTSHFTLYTLDSTLYTPL